VLMNLFFLCFNLRVFYFFCFTENYTNFSNVPQFGTREVLIIYGSLTSCDPGNIQSTISKLKRNNIMCSIIGLAAEVYICKEICSQTSGQYSVVRNDKHFISLLNHHLQPPPLALEQTVPTPSFIHMGFPVKILQDSVFLENEEKSEEEEETKKGQKKRKNQKSDKPEKSEKLTKKFRETICACHKTPSSSGYFCPRCKSKQCDIPTNCVVCGLTLVSSSDLAQSYHFLFPLSIFARSDTEHVQKSPRESDSETEESDKIITCFGCNSKLVGDSIKTKCPSCKYYFCEICDNFIHEMLNTCPGCENN